MSRFIRSYGRRQLAAALLGASLVAGSVRAQDAVPPAVYVPPASQKSMPAAALALGAAAPSRRIELAAPSASERARLRRASAALPPGTASTRTPGVPSAKPGATFQRGPRRIGFARDLPEVDRSVRLADLTWEAAGEGQRAARIEVTSPGARALRVELGLPAAVPGLAVRFRGSAADAPVFGPYSGDELAALGNWSPVLDGERATVELALPDAIAAAATSIAGAVGVAGATSVAAAASTARATSTGDAIVALSRVSHLAVTGDTLRSVARVDGYLGTADPCELDFTCVDATTRQQLSSAAGAVARMIFTYRGDTFLCTGQLLNDASTSFTPYFLTADHCMDGDTMSGLYQDPGATAAAAKTLNTYWFFQAASCGDRSEPAFKVLTTGAQLLARSIDYDWLLLRLASPPPSGATFAAWSGSGPIASGTSATAIHHPSGDVKKVSRGTAAGYQPYTDGSSFILVDWGSGVTEPGSSGGGLFTFNAAGFYELRGTLSYGESYCTGPFGPDEYGRFDMALPRLREYLTPTAANPSQVRPAVEYWNPVLSDFFVTASPQEIAALDGGQFGGWVRTGLRFLVYTDAGAAPASAQAVCRYYVDPRYGDSHFYSASPSECAAVAQLFRDQWIFESSSVFYIEVPTATGTCPASTVPIYRFMEKQNGLHHRYVIDVDLRDALIQSGAWTQEGNGTPPDAPVMCAPAG